MTDEERNALVERLRHTVCHGSLGCERLGVDDQAADQIEADGQEIERLKESLEVWIFHHQRALGEDPDKARAYAKAWLFRNANGGEPE